MYRTSKAQLPYSTFRSWIENLKLAKNPNYELCI